jgi:hypothetical protein
MSWLTWRQFRAQAITAAAALAVLAIVLLVTGIGLAHAYNNSGLPGCHGSQACGTEAGSFINQVKGNIYHLVFYLSVFLVYAAPAVMGVFWGAPLVTREIEAGTFRLAWNQSVTRRRWLAVKLGLIGLAAMATSGLLTLMSTWWARPLYAAAQKANANSLSISRLEPPLFGASGIAPVGYAAFAFALGVTLGLVIRRTVPAMATTLAGFVGVQLAWPTWIRQHLIAPAHLTAPLNVNAINELTIQGGPGSSNTMTIVAANPSLKAADWVLSNQTVTSADRPFTGPATKACATGTPQQCNAWLASKHLQQIVTYQPASRFWEFQWYETAIFLTAGLALAALCTWLIRSKRIA